MENLTRADQFQYWLMEMDSAIDRFIDSSPADVREKLDRTSDSLETLESYVLSRYASVADTSLVEEAGFLDGAARYLGEIFRINTGARWRIEIDDPKLVFLGVPTLSGGDKIGSMPVCPLALVTASTDRRTGRYFSMVFNNLVGRK